MGKWFSAWLEVSEYQRYYRYLYETDTKAFVGEIAYHYDNDIAVGNPSYKLL